VADLDEICVLVFGELPDGSKCGFSGDQAPEEKVVVYENDVPHPFK
jgi:hypothetical protein